MPVELGFVVAAVAGLVVGAFGGLALMGVRPSEAVRFASSSRSGATVAQAKAAAAWARAEILERAARTRDARTRPSPTATQQPSITGTAGPTNHRGRHMHTDAYGDLPTTHQITPPPTVREGQHDIVLYLWLRQELHARPEAMAQLIETFYDRLLAEPDIASYFAGVDMLRLRNHFLRALIIVADKGLTVGTIRGLVKAHANVRNIKGAPITPEVYDHVIGILVGLLQDNGVPPDGIASLAKTIMPLRDAIIHVPA